MRETFYYCWKTFYQWGKTFYYCGKTFYQWGKTFYYCWKTFYQWGKTFYYCGKTFYQWGKTFYYCFAQSSAYEIRWNLNWKNVHLKTLIDCHLSSNSSLQFQRCFLDEQSYATDDGSAALLLSAACLIPFHEMCLNFRAWRADEFHLRNTSCVHR